MQKVNLWCLGGDCQPITLGGSGSSNKPATKLEKSSCSGTTIAPMTEGDV